VFEALKAVRIYVRYFPDDPTSEYLRITIGTDEQTDRLIGEEAISKA
jgi:histidinol-phosphate/aromatic aminotransferase/cobyric acid decarboxylase-like protein